MRLNRFVEQAGNAARPEQTVTSREGIVTTLVPHTSAESQYSNPLGVTTTLSLSLYIYLYRLDPLETVLPYPILSPGEGKRIQ